MRNVDEPLRVTACFVTNSETMCVPNEECWFTEMTYNTNCWFNGAADDFLKKLLPTLSRSFNATKRCVWESGSIDARGCDITFGASPGPFSLQYHVDTIAALSQPEISYSPFDFLNPFSWEVWLALAVIVFIATPLAMAIVEYDPGESLVANFKKFVPDSIHAHTGSDILSNDTPDKNTSYVLSVFVALFSFIVLCMYAANLTAYVLYKDDYHIRGKDIVVDSALEIDVPGATRMEFFNIVLEVQNGLTKSATVVGEHRILSALKGCADVIVSLDIPVGKWVEVYVREWFQDVKRFTDAYDIVTRPLVDTSCSDDQKPMTLAGIYGLFLVVFVPAGLIIATTCMKYVYNRIKKKSNDSPSPTESPSPRP